MCGHILAIANVLYEWPDAVIKAIPLSLSSDHSAVLSHKYAYILSRVVDGSSIYMFKWALYHRYNGRRQSMSSHFMRTSVLMMKTWLTNTM